MPLQNRMADAMERWAADVRPLGTGVSLSAKVHCMIGQLFELFCSQLLKGWLSKDKRYKEHDETEPRRSKNKGLKKDLRVEN